MCCVKSYSRRCSTLRLFRRKIVVLASQRVAPAGKRRSCSNFYVKVYQRHCVCREICGVDTCAKRHRRIRKRVSWCSAEQPRTLLARFDWTRFAPCISFSRSHKVWSRGARNTGTSSQINGETKPMCTLNVCLAPGTLPTCWTLTTCLCASPVFFLVDRCPIAS